MIEEGAKDVILGTPVAVIVHKKEHIALFADFSPASKSAAPAAPKAAAAGTPAPEAAKAAPAHAAEETDSFKGRVFASPRARREALDKGIDIAKVKGTGPGGRIIHEDVAAFKQEAPAPKASSSSAPAKSMAPTAVASFIDIPTT